MEQNNLGKTIYFTGTMSGYYGATTDDLAKSVKVVLVAVDGGYNIKAEISGATKYINAVVSGNYKNFKIEDNASSIWVWNAQYKTFTTTLGSDTVYMGTYGTYNTFSISTIDKIGTSFPSHLYEYAQVSEDEAQDIKDAQDAKDVAADIAEINIATVVTDTLVLPATGAKGSAIAWAVTEGSAIVINEDGTVVITRPAIGEADATVKLTAVISKGNISETKEYNVTVAALVEESGEQESKLLATFTFGANGSATHNDGDTAGIGASKSFTADGYTLTLTGAEKVYDKAYDAKGNSCLKLGTSSKVGKFSFTVADDVNSVVIYVAKYKANTTKVNVNGTEYSVTTASNDGEYMAITIDTSVNKTVSLTTVSGGVRCMIDTIEFHS